MDEYKRDKILGLAAKIFSEAMQEFVIRGIAMGLSEEEILGLLVKVTKDLHMAAKTVGLIPPDKREELGKFFHRLGDMRKEVEGDEDNNDELPPPSRPRRSPYNKTDL